MALDFAKLAFDVSLDLTAAFPLDARSYFESLDAAKAAAASAEEVGSTESAYYYGQIVAVVNNDSANLYIIQPNKTLGSVSSNIKLNPEQFIYNENGELSLANISDANEGQVLTIGSNGKIIWVTPIETYSKEELDTKFASAGKLKRIIVESVEEIATDYFNKEDFDSYIFMVPTGLENDSDKYDEYIILSTIDEDGILIKYVERVGSWEIDLKDYVKHIDLDDYVKKEEGYRLISTEEIDKFSQNERNIINNVSNDFVITEDRTLEISGTGSLSTTLNNKVDKKEGYTLLSPEDQKKLAALNLEGTDLEISGTIQAGNVQGLNTWLTEHGADYIVNLGVGNLEEELSNKINSSITAINSDQFILNDNGQLELSDKILNQTYVTLSNFNTVVGDLNTLLSNQFNIYNEIVDINDRLTWKDIVD